MRQPAGGCCKCGIHGTSDFEHDHQIGVGQQRARLEAEMHGMARRQADRARIMRDDRNGAALGQMPEHLDRGGAQRGGNDQRALGRRDPFGERRDAARIRIGVGRLRARLHRPDRLGQRRRQRLARQHQIDRPARMRHRDFNSARRHIADLAGLTQFVIPFHQLAHHAGLIEHFLRPMDRARARAERALLGDRRAPGAEDERRAVARQVGEVVDGVGGADIDVHHHRLRVAVHQVGAMRHGDREIFMRHQNGSGYLGVGLLGAAEGFHDRREIGAGIGEEIIDAVVGERAQEALRGDHWPLCGRCGHLVSPPSSACVRMFCLLRGVLLDRGWG